MLGYFMIGTLAAFGALCALWALLGWLIPGEKGCAIVCYGVPDEQILWRIRWLKGWGLLRAPLLVVTEKTDIRCPDAEICRVEALLPRLEWERDRFHGTGNGDHTGCHQGRGISEL